MFIMSKDILHKSYESEDLNDVVDDINERLNSEIMKDTDFEQGLLKGKLKVSVVFLHEDDCECQGFDHAVSCKHHVMCY